MSPAAHSSSLCGADMLWAVSWSSKACVPALSRSVLRRQRWLRQRGGSSARVPCCKRLQQGKVGMAVTAPCFFLCGAILYRRGLETLKRDSNASLSHNPIFLRCCATQVLQGFFLSYPGKRHRVAKPQGSFLSYSPKFPLCGNTD